MVSLQFSPDYGVDRTSGGGFTPNIPIFKFMIPIFRQLIRFLKKGTAPKAISSRKHGLEASINAIQADIEILVKKECTEKFSVCWYGAYYINPRHLVYWVCIQTDVMKKKLEANKDLLVALRSLLETHSYPQEARSNVFIGFESQETVDRESKGNWFHHFK